MYYSTIIHSVSMYDIIYNYTSMHLSFNACFCSFLIVYFIYTPPCLKVWGASKPTLHLEFSFFLWSLRKNFHSTSCTLHNHEQMKSSKIQQYIIYESDPLRLLSDILESIQLLRLLRRSSLYGMLFLLR